MRLSGWVCDFSLSFWQGVLYGSETLSVAHALSDEDTRGNRLMFTFLVPVSIAHSLCVADVQFNGSLHYVYRYSHFSFSLTSSSLSSTSATFD
jgi:hypothetical protein